MAQLQFDNPEVLLPAADNIQKATKLNSPTLQVELTGDAFQILGQAQKGIPPELIGFIAALIILALVFRTFLRDDPAAGQRRRRRWPPASRSSPCSPTR